MSPTELLDRYAHEPSASGHGESFREEDAGRTFAALRDVLVIHRRVTIDHTTFCPACREPTFPCATVRAISAALEAS